MIGASLVIALATLAALWVQAAQRAAWARDDDAGPALLIARAVASTAAALPPDDPEAEGALQAYLVSLRDAIPGVEEILALQGVRFIAHTDPALVGTRLKRDNLEHKSLYDDRRALEEKLLRNREERAKFEDLTHNPFPTSIVEPSASGVFVAVPIERRGDASVGLVALKRARSPREAPGGAMRWILLGAGLIVALWLGSSFVPEVDSAWAVGFFIVGGIVLMTGTLRDHDRRARSAYEGIGSTLLEAHRAALASFAQARAGRAAGRDGEDGDTLRRDTSPPDAAPSREEGWTPPPLDSFLASLNQDTHGDPVARLEFDAERRTLKAAPALTFDHRILLWGQGGILALLALWIVLRLGGWTERIFKGFLDHWYAYAYISPAVIGTAVLVFGPFLFGIGLAFFTRVYSQYEFVGLRNFVEILSDFEWTRSRNFYRTLGVTVMWTVVNVSLHVSIGLGLAMILKDRALRFTSVYRTLLVIPWALPNYITALIWKGMFNKEYGVVNIVLGTLGIAPVSWFNSFWGAFTANLVTNVWLGFPFMMVISLGALQSIPSDLYEAAEVDGAGRWDRFWRITVPLLKPALFPAIILGTIWTFNQFNVIYLVSGGAPEGKTDILITEAYRWAFEGRQQFGYAAAYSAIIFVILFGYTYVTNRLTRSTEGAYE